MHSFTPEKLCTSTIVPIPEGCNVNATDSADFRCLALRSIFVKIFDHVVVLQKYHDCCFSSELQFGFKAKHSTHMCTMILKETLMYYTTNNSTAFCKAFDIVSCLEY